MTIDGAPFPDVTWNQNEEMINYTERVFLSRYDASLMFTTVTNDDDGTYNVLLTNANGSVTSINITISVTGKRGNRY